MYKGIGILFGPLLHSSATLYVRLVPPHSTIENPVSPPLFWFGHDFGSVIRPLRIAVQAVNRSVPLSCAVAAASVWAAEWRSLTQSWPMRLAQLPLSDLPTSLSGRLNTNEQPARAGGIADALG